MLVSLFIFLTIANPVIFADDASLLVQGNCRIMTQADQGSLTLTHFELDQKSIETAVNKLQKKIDSFKKILEKEKLTFQEIRTQQFSFYEKKEWEQNKNVFKGYEARESIYLLASDFKILSRVITLASQHGIKEIGELQFSLAKKTTIKIQEKCLIEATEDAHQKAQVLASAAKRKLGPLMKLREDEASHSSFQKSSSNMFLSKSSRESGPELSPGEIEIHKSVTAEYKLP